MPDILLVQFLERWIRDDEFRRKVLHKEKTTLSDYGLLDSQIQKLLTLDKDVILAEIAKEFEDLGVDLDKAKREMKRPSPSVIMSGQMMYSEGAVHVRGVTPQLLKRGEARHVVIRGQGLEWDSQLQDIEVDFNHKDVAAPILCTPVIDFGCDVDVYQRVTVEVTLDKLGIWKVRARNRPSPYDNTAGWSAEEVVVLVTETGS